MSPPTVVLVGTLDTKGDEYAFLRERVHQAGVATLLVDVGTQGEPRTEADVPREEVATAGGFDLADLTDRGAAVAATGRCGRGAERRTAAVCVAIQRTEPFAPLRGNR